MSISASPNGSDIILSISMLVPNPLTGYRLERKREGAAWLRWTGSAFAESGDYALLASTRFCDFDLASGIYQYRSATVGLVVSAWDYSGWARIGTDKLGWTFGNYSAPSGHFGDILTVDDLRHTYLWGIDFKASNGATFTDIQIAHTINSAAAEIARALKITIKKTKILCQPDSSLAIGTDYDEAEDPYAYRHDKWNRTGRIILRRRPIISVERFGFYSISDQRVIDLLSWARIDHRKGVVTFFPKSGSSGEFRVYPAALTMGMSGMSGDYPGGYKIDYTAGWEDASRVPDDLREIIAKVAACKLLNIIGDGLLAGFASSSISMDGVSESFSSTASATNAYFGSRIQVYLKDIENYLNENRNKFGVMVMGSI